MSKSSKNIKDKLIQKKPRSYLNRDFNSFRSELLDYSRTHYSDKIQDFSEASMGGLFLDMAAYVGDVMSYYLDHQFNELDLETAVEDKNIEKLVRAAGVKISGAAPATVYVDFFIKSGFETTSQGRRPKTSDLPIIKVGTTVSSNTGVVFELGEDLDFSKKKADGRLIASYSIEKTDSSGLPTEYLLKLTGICKSGKTAEETFVIGDDYKQFRTIVLGSENITEIISVTDTERNEYYEVDSLTQDVVFKKVINTSDDSSLVSDNLELLPAPFRFISTASRQTGKTTIRFGSGDASTLDDDIIPDPSEVSLPLFGSKNTMKRFSIDPNALLKTRTLGVSPRGTKITVRYRAGGGLSHNVGSESIRSIKNLITKFSSGTPSSTISSVRASVFIINQAPAAGGESELTLGELKSVALAHRNSQSRIVTKQDLISRIYTMPANFGRVFRVGIRSNPNNPLSTIVAIVSRDASGSLIISPDTLKENVAEYLNEFRLISDAIDIVDARVLNVAVKYSIIVDSISNKELTIQKVNSELKRYLKIENFQIEQPLIISDLINIILNTPGVMSHVSVDIIGMSGNISNREYSNETFNIISNLKKGVLMVPPGSIIEVKYPDDDIIGSAE
ncbi:hypothetical protein CMI47_06690 [Candidatus Pacearchaeota archaeon]|nr:hypothetical protein [Candidatus Pacearchaeota archaeon]